MSYEYEEKVILFSPIVLEGSFESGSKFLIDSELEDELVRGWIHWLCATVSLTLLRNPNKNNTTLQYTFSFS